MIYLQWNSFTNKLVYENALKDHIKSDHPCPRHFPFSFATLLRHPVHSFLYAIDHRFFTSFFFSFFFSFSQEITPRSVLQFYQPPSTTSSTPKQAKLRGRTKNHGDDDDPQKSSTQRSQEACAGHYWWPVTEQEKKGHLQTLLPTLYGSRD